MLCMVISFIIGVLVGAVLASFYYLRMIKRECEEIVNIITGTVDPIKNVFRCPGGEK
jgi:hypothetical protein